ncbi:thrombin inhibitor hemalin-like [Oratosquilla oratoria]|uniref:thrombin inhibitor hemalin-like n=1 Tax=Oratosquilla oratoria TaxID=337810 RepID=UPI003F7639EF
MELWLWSVTAMAALMTPCRSQLLAGTLLGQRPLLLRPACLMPVDTGRCRASIPSMFFNATTGTCDCFYYGGCGGNANRFPDVLSCMSTCNVTPQQQQTIPQCKRTTTQPQPQPLPPPRSRPMAKCLAPPETGLCRAKFPTVYYNTTTETCDCFYYGGCGGNDNRFRDIMSCMKDCDVTADRQFYTDSCRIVFAKPGTNAIIDDAAITSVNGGAEEWGDGDDEGVGEGY